MRNAYDLPGSTMLSVSLPNGNGLTADLVGAPSPDVSGTDPASSARESLAAYVPQAAPASFPGVPSAETLGKVGRVVAFGLLALILVALGAWIVVKQ